MNHSGREYAQHPLGDDDNLTTKKTSLPGRGEDR